MTVIGGKIINSAELSGEPGAIAKISEFKDRTDPTYVGPGIWDIIHKFSRRAQTPQKEQKFVKFMKKICSEFSCETCKVHCTEYIKNHPLEDEIGVILESEGENIPIGMFVWGWKFHNAVNSRLGKPIMSWDTAYNLYFQSENMVCSSSCLDAGKPGKDQPVDSPTARYNIKPPGSFRMIRPGR